jgi:hypothetical protein
MKTLLLLLLAFCLYTAPAHADPVRLQRLTTVFTDFREAFIFWSQCSDFKKETAAHPRFMKNWELMLETYRNEARVEHSEYSADEIDTAIKKKSQGIQRNMVDRYKEKDVCTSAYAEQMKKTIAMFDGQSQKDMMKMLNDIGN